MRPAWVVGLSAALLPSLCTPTLVSAQQKLDTVQVVAPGELAGSIPEFDARRARGVGRFLAAADLRKHDDRALYEVLRTRMPGLAVQSVASGTFLYNRNQQPPDALRGNAGKPCYVQLVEDGVTVYQQGGGGSDATPPDVSGLLTRNFDAVEFYATVSMTPPEFRTAGATCGTLILWSRRR